ncbi:unnamed protein product, partial [Meganyctiphanes norvegica]
MFVFAELSRNTLSEVVHVISVAYTFSGLSRKYCEFGKYQVQECEMPWQVSLQQHGSHFCGATLIGQHWAVTAAHCTRNIDYNHVTAMVGGWDLNEKNTEYDIKKVIVGDYHSATMTNDIALLRLVSKPKKRSSRVDQKAIPIALDQRQEVADEECVVSGWGRLSESGSLPNILRATMVNLLTDDKCQEMVHSASSYKTFTTNLCAGGGERDACQGDSGGPLVCCRKSSEEVSGCRLSGITSWGIGCATRGVPGIYTEVGHYVDWIQKHIEEEDGHLRQLEDGHLRQLVKFKEDSNPEVVEVENLNRNED